MTNKDIPPPLETKVVPAPPSRYWGRWAQILDTLETLPEGQALEVQTLLSPGERNSLRWAAGWRGYYLRTRMLPRSTVVWVSERMEESYRERAERRNR